jgi:hypothetical protein
MLLLPPAQPGAEVGGQRRLVAPDGFKGLPLVLVPPSRRAAEPLSGELLEDGQPTGTQQAGDGGHGRVERLDVVQRDARHRGIEAGVVREVLQPRAPEDRSFRGVGINGGHRVAGACQYGRQLAVATADLITRAGGAGNCDSRNSENAASRWRAGSSSP